MPRLNLTLNARLQPMHRHDIEDQLDEHFAGLPFQVETDGGGTGIAEKRRNRILRHRADKRTQQLGGAAPEAAPASAESCQPATHEAVPFAWMRHDVPLLVRYSPIFFLLIVGNLALKQMYLLWRGCTGRQRRSAWLLLLSFAVAGVGFFFTARKVGMLPPSFAPPPPAECQPASKPLSFFR